MSDSALQSPPAASPVLPSIPEEKQLPLDVPAPKPVGERLDLVKRQSVLNVLATYRQMVKRLALEVEELEPISRVFKDLNGQVQGQPASESVSVHRQSVLNIMITFRQMVKRMNLEVEELEPLSRVFKDLESQLSR
jgi:tRNA C32,U32 (ribose-2'-O)-methylase TrmJ